MKKSLNGADWTLTGWNRHQWQFEKRMETDGFSTPVVMPVQAVVPGSVQTDLLRAGQVEDWRQDQNFFHLEWVENREWIYEKRFTLSQKELTGHCFLHFEGLDFWGFVFLNGKRVLAFDQMHIPYEIDVSDAVVPGCNVLKVVFLQPPEVDGQVGYTSRTTILKSRFNYGWDWTPRLVNIGIYGDVYLRLTGDLRFSDWYPEALVEQEGGELHLHYTLEGEKLEEARLCAVVRYQGETVARMEKDAGGQEGELCLRLPHVELWHPNNMGEQPLYTVQVSLLDANGRESDREEKTVGFRHVEYLCTEGAKEGSMPYALAVNGRRMTMFGVNWVPISAFYGSVTEEDYTYYLDRLRQMNVNILRVWGGALLESETFYRLCDERGLLVWQEFPQSSSGIDNTPCNEQEFVQRLVAVAESDVRRRRHHPSLAIWCGGNELYHEDFRPMDPECANLKALAEVVRRLDPTRLYLPSSPSGACAGFKKELVGSGLHGDTHGPWTYSGTPDYYAQLNADDSQLKSEVGAASCPRIETLRRWCSGSLWPPTSGNPFWLNRGSWWLYYEEICQMFGSFDGKQKGVEEYVKAYRYTQMEAMRYAAASVRRRGKKSAGILIWMANEPFPNSANTSVMEYDGCPKPAYYALQRAFAPVMLGLAYSYPGVAADGEVSAELFICSEDAELVERVHVEVFDMQGSCLYNEDFGSFLVQGTKEVAQLHMPAKAPLVIVRATASTSRGPLREEYLFTVGNDAVFEALLDAPSTPLLVTRKAPDRFIMINEGTSAALCLDCIGEDEEGMPLLVDGCYASLLPGEEIELCTSGPCARLTVEAMGSRRLSQETGISGCRLQQAAVV